MKTPVYQSRKVAQLTFEEKEAQSKRLAKATELAKFHQVEKAMDLIEKENEFKNRFKAKCDEDEKVVIHKRDVFCEKLVESEEGESEREKRNRMKATLSTIYFE